MSISRYLDPQRLVRRASRAIDSAVDATLAPLSFVARGRYGRIGKNVLRPSMSLESLVSNHFQIYPEHVCRPTLSAALSMLDQSPATIVETGSSAWGANSTLLFDQYVNSFGGHVESVDIRLRPLLTLSPVCTPRTELRCDDSVHFLRSRSLEKGTIDLLYLDSWDLDASNPIPSMLHGLAEFVAASAALVSGSLLLIDDTPRDEDSALRAMSATNVDSMAAFRRCYGIFPGKGALVKLYLDATGRGEVLRHEYQLLVRL